MADEKQLERLKSGVEEWNAWREANPNVEIDLIEAELSSANLFEANLNSANLIKANLVSADLHSANLHSTDLTEANLSNAILIEADLRYANLIEANLRYANLSGANFCLSTLNKTDFFKAELHSTQFSKTNLSEALHLEKCMHSSSSSLDHATLAVSGQLPEAFLQGCGLSDWEIEQAKLHQPGLSNSEINDIIYRIYDIRATQSIQIAPMFISYTHANSDFVDKIGELLTEKGVRYWRDIHQMKAGRMEKQVDRAMRLNDLVLMVLSKESVESDWVEHEARKARSIEKEGGKDVMVPIALDDAWKTCKWPRRLREQIEEYNILDFSEWKDDDKLRKQFANLLNGIDLFYK